MLGLTQRIAFTALLLIGVVSSESKAFTIQECYAAVQRDYDNCAAGSLYPDYGYCRNRAAQGLVYCQQGRYVRPGTSQKDQCFTRVEAEHASCGNTPACSNRWIQGLNQCSSIPSNY
jgi:hypothetical protein